MIQSHENALFRFQFDGVVVMQMVLHFILETTVRSYTTIYDYSVNKLILINTMISRTPFSYCENV